MATTRRGAAVVRSGRRLLLAGLLLLPVGGRLPLMGARLLLMGGRPLPAGGAAASTGVAALASGGAAAAGGGKPLLVGGRGVSSCQGRGCCCWRSGGFFRWRVGRRLLAVVGLLLVAARRLPLLKSCPLLRGGVCYQLGMRLLMVGGRLLRGRGAAATVRVATATSERAGERLIPMGFLLLPAWGEVHLLGARLVSSKRVAASGGGAGCLRLGGGGC